MLWMNPANLALLEIREFSSLNHNMTIYPLVGVTLPLLVKPLQSAGSLFATTEALVEGSPLTSKGPTNPNLPIEATQPEEAPNSLPGLDYSAASGSSGAVSTEAGILSRYLMNWQNISSDKFFLKVVSEGYKLQFIDSYILSNSVLSFYSCPIRCKAIQDQIDSNLSINAISKVNPHPSQLLSRILLVKKANGKNRMIIDLSLLNLRIHKNSFKMKYIDHIWKLLEPNDFMVSIDLADAFFSIPVHDDYKKYLFQFQQSDLSIQCSSFWLNQFSANIF